MEQVKTKRAIATTRSFETSLTELADLKERISTFASSCAEKLRRQNSSCHVLVVFLSSDRFKIQSPQYRVSRMVSIPFPTNSSLVLTSRAVKAITSIYKKGIYYKKAGVVLTGIVPTYNRQMQLFDHQDIRHQPLMSAMDHINKKYAAPKLKLANQDLTRTWKMRQAHLSPQYTTNLNDIITVKCQKTHSKH